MKIISLLTNKFYSEKDTAAFVTNNAIYKYTDIYTVVCIFINKLQTKNVSKGQRVVVISDHDENAVFFILAASAIGLQILMPYNLQDTALPEWSNIIETSKPDHIVFLKKNIDLISLLTKSTSVNIVEIRGNNLKQADHLTRRIPISSPELIENFLILFTSGTTGKPKAISISEELIYKRFVTVSTKLKFNSAANIFMSGLMNNTTGIIFSLGSLLHRATLFFPDNSIIEDWPQLIDKWKITHMMLRPVSMKRFLDSAKKLNSNLNSMRVVAYGAAVMPVKTLEEGRSLMTCEWVQGYGLSETFGPFCWLTEDDHQKKIYKKYIYCVGTPDNSVEVSLDFNNTDQKIGEIILRNSMMTGYYDFTKNEIIPVKDWFHTGDYGEFSVEGKLVLKGRIANTILSKNGHRIYPEEIENLIRSIPDFEEVLLLSFPSTNNLGNNSVICIYSPRSKSEYKYIKNIILKKLIENLSKEKWPDYLFISNIQFPKSQNDKPLKNDILNLIEPSKLIKLNASENYETT